MQFQQAIKNVFEQLSHSLDQLSDEQYRQPGKILFGASIGQHVRHVIELFICLNQGYETGTVNYENRKRDIRIETDRIFANDLLQMIANNLGKANKDLLLEAAYDETSTDTVTVATNYSREIIYNLEHTVHHMALIRVGINEVSSIDIPDGFGIASSTIKYRNSCAQ
jgi:uncharacterized damage-inducible protein DinB